MLLYTSIHFICYKGHKKKDTHKLKSRGIEQTGHYQAYAKKKRQKQKNCKTVLIKIVIDVID